MNQRETKISVLGGKKSILEAKCGYEWKAKLGTVTDPIRAETGRVTTNNAIYSPKTKAVHEGVRSGLCGGSITSDGLLQKEQW